MILTASKLRENVYKVLDEVIETGEPAEIMRKGVKLRIVVEAPATSKLSKMKHRDGLVGDPDDLVSMDWSHLWNPGDLGDL